MASLVCQTRPPANKEPLIKFRRLAIMGLPCELKEAVVPCLAEDVSMLPVTAQMPGPVAEAPRMPHTVEEWLDLCMEDAEGEEEPGPFWSAYKGIG